MTGGTPVPTTARLGSSMGARLSAMLNASLAELRVHISHCRQIRRAWPRIQLAEQRVVARLRLELRDAAVRIVLIAEHNRVCRADLLAGGLDFAVADPPILFFRLDLRFVDALHAVRALLHHAA